MVKTYTTLHLVKRYCLPALLYGYKVWHLNDSSMQKISVAYGTTASDVFFHAAGEKALNHNSIFAAHCQYHSCYTSANYCFGKNCTALNQLFYNHYLVVCIRLLLLLVVYTMCYSRNCQTTQRTDLEFFYHVCELVIWVHYFCVALCFFNFCIAVSGLYNCISGCHLA